MSQELHVVWNCKQRPEELVGWIGDRLVGVKGVATIGHPEPCVVEVTGQSTPTWAVVVAIILFPIGLLALIAKDPFSARVTGEQVEGGTRLRIDGRVNGHLHQRLLALYKELGDTVSV